ncbi:DUF1064 domain-containing protein [Bacillus anthracis]
MRGQRNSKYNAKKTEIDGIKFASALESKYYLHLKELQAQGVVTRFELRPSFTLLAGFTDNYGVYHYPIKYVADFLVYYAGDKQPVVVDTKGLKTSDFKIKRKLYCSMFPLELKLINYSKIDGGWIECDALKEARKLRKKAKEAKQNG